MTKNKSLNEEIDDLEARFKKLKAAAIQTKDARTRGEVKLEALVKADETLKDKIKSLGLEPDSLKAKIIEIKAKVAGNIQKLEDILPDENGIIKSQVVMPNAINEVKDMRSPESPDISNEFDENDFKSSNIEEKNIADLDF